MELVKISYGVALLLLTSWKVAGMKVGKDHLLQML